MSRRTLRDLCLLVIGVLILTVGVWYVVPSRPAKLKLKITAGTAIGPRHSLALELKSKCQAKDIELEVIPTEGSDLALRSLDQGQLDLAFVQGGLTGSQYSSVRQVAPLHVEPLHLLVSDELYTQIQRDGLTALGGQRINTGVIGSGTHALAVTLLNFLGLTSSAGSSANDSPAANVGQSYADMNLSYDQLLELKSSELPDAVFSISSLPSAFAKELIEHRGYKLVELPFADAFALNGTQSSQLLEVGKSSRPANFDQSQVIAATIPAFTYSVRLQQPPKPMTTIGTRLLLVANKTVPEEAIERLLTTLFDSSIAKRARPPLDISVMESAPEFSWHQGALNFIAHHQPLVAGSFVELAANGLAIVGSVVGAAFFLIQWYRRSRQHHFEARFRDYLNSVLEIEKQLVTLDAQGSIPVRELVDLHQRLVDLKREVANRFFSGELDGQALMLGFMTLTNDVRNHIARLMIHERDNVEEAADKEHKSVQSMWNERLKRTLPTATTSPNQSESPE